MTFLAPLFLLGALAITLPVVFHLIRRTTREHTLFSSLMFLTPTPPRLTRRSRLEHILLLVLRCAVLVLLAAGFARPLIKRSVTNDQPAATARRVLVLVDTSASMRRADLWRDARDRVETILSKASPIDQVAVYTFDRQVNPVVSFDEWNSSAVGARRALVSGKLAAISPGWSSTDLGNALITAAETLADIGGKAPLGPGEIVLVSDFQEGSRLEQIQGYEWPKGVQVSQEVLKPKHESNAALQLVTELNESSAKTDPAVRVRVSNAANSKREQFKVGWTQPDGRTFTGRPLEIYVPAGQSRIVPVPAPEGGQTLERIVLQGDDEDFDNTIFAIPPEKAQATVLYIGGESEKSPSQQLYFVQRAFQETRRQAVRVLVRAPQAPLSAAELQSATLVLVADPLPEGLAMALREQVVTGKTVFVTMKNDRVSSTLARLLKLEQLTLEEGRPNNYALLGQIDFRHPLFAPFADPRFSDFTKIHFWKYLRMKDGEISGAHTLARFDSGDPALVEVPAGRGRILILTSGWAPEDSQLALSTKFVPLLYSILEQSGAPAPPPQQYHVGDIVPLTSWAQTGQSPLSIRLPDSSVLNLAAGETNLTKTFLPGVYAVTSAQPARRLAVNLDAAESRTAPLPLDELERLGAPMARQAVTPTHEDGRQIRLKNAELESRQKLWRWFITLTLGLLLVETWLAGRTARRTTAS